VLHYLAPFARSMVGNTLLFALVPILLWSISQEQGSILGQDLGRGHGLKSHVVDNIARIIKVILIWLSQELLNPVMKRAFNPEEGVKDLTFLLELLCYYMPKTILVSYL
jgi:hypothetical protein